MEEKERQIISHLRKDARTSLAAISQEIEMPISTVYDKINRMQQNNIIKKHTIIVDFPKLGYHYHAKIALKIQKKQKEELVNFLKNHLSVNSIYEINNGFDLFVETFHKNVKEYLEFMDSLQEGFEIIEIKEYQVINEIENEKFFLAKS